MGERIRAFDWDRHPFGPPDNWPPALRAALGICLNSSFPTSIYWGPELRLLYNDAWSHIPAERHPWALGRPGAEVWTDIWEVVGPQFEHVVTKAEGFSTFDQMLPMQRGGRIEETYWNYSLTPILGEDGKVAGVLNQGHETTEIIKAARAREAETERLRVIFEQAPGAIAVLRGPAHTFEIANAAYMELVGSRRDIVGRGVAEALPEVVKQGFVKLLDQVYRSGEPYVGTGVPVDLDRGDRRETRIVDFVFQPSRNVLGDIEGIFVQATDVTERARLFAELQNLNATLEERVAAEVAERTRAEEQLRQAQKMEAVGQLTGGIAHDFNNMLAVVIGGLSLLQRRLARGETDVSRYVDAAMEGASRASALTQRLLAFSRQQPLEPQNLDANKLVASMTDLLTRTLGEHIQVETVLGAGLWRCFADQVQLESSILNLAVNARDAMPEGGKLTIDTANVLVDAAVARDYAVPEGQYVMIAVTDTGTGMTADVMAQAFDPFFTTKSVGKGSGLGLSQVFGFVRQSGGHVKLYSEVGVGTTVKLYLPRHHGSEPLDLSVRDAEKAPTGHRSEVVLVVEDEERVRNYSCEALTELGYAVVDAAGGPQALRIIDSGQRVDLLFTDIVMPEMNGRQLADKAMQKLPELKVLFTTGYTRNAVVHNGVLDSGTAFLQKPFTVDQLAAKVRQVLDS